jgi:hypothetical protein
MWVEALKICSIRPDEHIAHEQSIVGAGTIANDADADPDSVRLVPPRKSIDNIDTISCIGLVNGSVAINTPHLHMRSKLALARLAQQKCVEMEIF